MNLYHRENFYPSDLIQFNLVKQRSKRSENDDSTLHSYTYKYKVRITRDDSLIEQQVCYVALKNLQGISGRRVQTIQYQLSKHDKVLPDQRGKHKIGPMLYLRIQLKRYLHEFSSP